MLYNAGSFQAEKLNKLSELASHLSRSLQLETTKYKNYQ